MKLQQPLSDDAVPRVPWRWFPLILLGLFCAIAAATWPWATGFASSLFSHWDPPFHTWKLNFAAQEILNGNLLPAEGNTNMYYPYSGAFYYEALHWPQAAFAALFRWVTGAGPVLTYHVTLVFFWALSGAVFWALLRALGTSAAAALGGAVVFTVMPYRMSYVVEFNMQLNFAIVLFYFCLLRYVQRPRLPVALGVALAWWMQATSELYQAFFAVLLFPLLALALFRGRWRTFFGSRRVWLHGLAAVALCGVLTLVWLLPYAKILHGQTLNRGLAEITTHVLEPFSYLRPYSWITALPKFLFEARYDEMSVYPTLLVLVLAAVSVAGAWHGRGTGTALPPRLFGFLRWGRLALWGLFWVQAALLNFGMRSLVWGTSVAWLPVLICFATLLLLLGGRRETPAVALLEGLGAMATLAFFMSLGPYLNLPKTDIRNPLFLTLYEHLEALSGFRVVSRYAFFVLLWLVLAAACGWDQITRMRSRGGRRALTALTALLACSFLLGVPYFPRRTPPIRIDAPIRSDVLDAFDALPGEHVLAVAPMGDRSYDSREMLSVGGHDRLFVWAWGGTYPHYTLAVRNALHPRKGEPDAEESARLLSMLWPECLVLEDKAYTRTVFRKDFTQILSGQMDLVAEDERFALLRLRPQPPREQFVKLFRHDFCVSRPVCEFAFKPAPDADAAPDFVEVDFNGRVLGRYPVDGETHRVLLPAAFRVRYAPNKVRFQTGRGQAVLSRFDLVPPDENCDKPAPDDGAPPPLAGGWTRSLPPDLQPLEAMPGRHVRLCGVQFPEGVPVQPGETRPLRLALQFPGMRPIQPLLSLQVCAAQDGSVIYRTPPEPVGQHIEEQLMELPPPDAVYTLTIPCTLPDENTDLHGKEVSFLLQVLDARGRHIGKPVPLPAPAAR